MIRFTCTNCKQRYKSEDDLAGDEIECRKCGTTVLIPIAEPPAEKINLMLKKTSVDLKPKGLKAPSLSLPGSMKKTGIDLKKPEGLKVPSLSLPNSMKKTGVDSENTGGLKVPSLTLPNSMNKKVLLQKPHTASL